ncbi:MAG: succinyl-diaminopimelate desuccinylase [Alphaproteobacteria bacterium]|nr:succinyl-diaminopimelate desuccinylase [Alphaproteobacteria bacterium]
MCPPLADDPVPLAQAMIRIASVTPDCGAAFQHLTGVLEAQGFTCRMLRFEAPGTPPVDNLFARLGEGAPHFAFAGHLDTVPVGEAAAWSLDPFGGLIDQGRLFGRGAADMKSAIAAFITAAARLPAEARKGGTISLLITGDEEGPSVNGTVKLMEALAAEGIRPDHCLVGEPTSLEAVGDTIKVGRRGSATVRLTVTGAQGHVAYPHLADNPVPKMLEILRRLDARALDEGTPHFPPSNLEILSVDVGNTVTNLIPATARALINVRHNDLHTAESLFQWVRETAEAVISEQGGAFSMTTEIGARAFLTPPGPFIALLSNAVAQVTGRTPEPSTSGGTSDARFIKDYCPVAELGLVGQSMHKADENARLSDIRALSDIYADALKRYFAGGISS